MLFCKFWGQKNCIQFTLFRMLNKLMNEKNFALAILHCIGHKCMAVFVEQDVVDSNKGCMVQFVRHLLMVDSDFNGTENGEGT